MRKEDIQTKIDAIFDNLEKLKFFSSKTYEEFIADFRNIDSALHRLQTSIQALLDIGSYINVLERHRIYWSAVRKMELQRMEKYE
ncbi:MAG: HepT-like ribonuclease domain-containing protein [Nitrospinota bacterium]